MATRLAGVNANNAKVFRNKNDPFNKSNSLFQHHSMLARAFASKLNFKLAARFLSAISFHFEYALTNFMSYS